MQHFPATSKKRRLTDSGGDSKKHLAIFPTVRVPVLSEHNTDIQPKVSIVAKFFTRTLCLAMRFAIMVSDKATQMGNPCGDVEYQ